MSETLSLPFTPADPQKIVYTILVLIAKQPIGDIYVAAMKAPVLAKIAHFDVRRILDAERDFENYLGIQRPLNRKRVEELKKYVGFVDATFPTSVIIAISEEYVSLSDDGSTLTIRNFRVGESEPSIAIGNVARVLDGQHRIAGLENYLGGNFDVPVSIFTGIDIADQAYIFSTVNLEQTKVSKSLAYDLFALSRSRSPQKVCHNVAIVLDRDVGGPFYKRIKRLGVATPGRSSETITQATFVEALMRFISRSPKEDRDVMLRGRVPKPYEGADFERFIFRGLFLNGDDALLTSIVSNYFSAVAIRWPSAWTSGDRGVVLGKTSGFRALMKFLYDVYSAEADARGALSVQRSLEIFRRVEVDDDYFNTDNFKPGSSGEADLYKLFVEASSVGSLI